MIRTRLSSHCPGRWHDADPADPTWEWEEPFAGVDRLPVQTLAGVQPRPIGEQLEAAVREYRSQMDLPTDDEFHIDALSEMLCAEVGDMIMVQREHREMASDLSESLDLLARLEWSGVCDSCVGCGVEYITEGTLHAKGCRVARLLGRETE